MFSRKEAKQTQAKTNKTSQIPELMVEKARSTCGFSGDSDDLEATDRECWPRLLATSDKNNFFLVTVPPDLTRSPASHTRTTICGAALIVIHALLTE